MNKNDDLSPLATQFGVKLDEIITRNSLVLQSSGIAVAYSGGLDSSALMALAVSYCKQKAIPLFAFHIHHGLSRNADDWLFHCEKESFYQQVTFDFIKVTINNDQNSGIEASARTARYRALGELCTKWRVPLILSAHHQDDQAETILLQLLRGSGVAGLSGMSTFNRAPGLFGTNNVILARPLLETAKQLLQEYVEHHRIDFIEDESNQDTHFFRNALRQKVMPLLSEIAPGYAARLSRSSYHAQASIRMMRDIAEQDIQACSENGALIISKMRSLEKDRVDNLLRLWISKSGAKMPSTSRLAEISKQLFCAKQDARLSVFHDNVVIHRYQDKISIDDRHLIDKTLPTEIELTWQGEELIDLPQLGGKLQFCRSDYGLEASELLSATLTIHQRRGGERLRLAKNRPSRDMKHHYQAHKVPFWQREKLPFVSMRGQLLFAAGIGMESTHCKMGKSMIHFQWIAN